MARPGAHLRTAAHAGCFVLDEAMQAGIPYVALPAAVSLRDPASAAAYAQAISAATQAQIARGAPVLSSLAIPTIARDTAGA